MGQAKKRGTPDERRELAIAWDEAHGKTDSDSRTLPRLVVAPRVMDGSLLPPCSPSPTNPTASASCGDSCPGA